MKRIKPITDLSTFSLPLESVGPFSFGVRYARDFCNEILVEWGLKYRAAIDPRRVGKPNPSSPQIQMVDPLLGNMLFPFDGSQMVSELSASIERLDEWLAP